MSGYTPLFESIIFSSIWQEPHTVRIVWVTMLAMADSQGVVEASVPGLAHAAYVTVDECRDALKCLSGPDPHSKTKDFEGRRIVQVADGWQILNFEKFREKAKNRAAYYRQWRRKRKGDSGADNEG